MRPFIQRLYELEEAAVLIAAGRLHHRVEHDLETDEVSRIGRQFNVMAEKIEEQVKTLRKLADENRALATDAEQYAAINERQRLARELHDSVSQQLFALAMLASSAVRLNEMNAPSLHETLLQLADIASASQREMRALLLHLRPIDLDGRDFISAATSFLEAVQERHQLRCIFEARTRETPEPAVEEQLFRILQEACANVLKHAEATQIIVIWETDDKVCRLTISDDGKGISDPREVGDSYGIRTMKERATALGGRCDIFNRQQGTAVEVQIPILGRQEGGTM